MSAVRIAVAGAGLIGRRHIQLTRSSDRCALAAVVDPAPAAAEVATEAGVPLYASLDELFATESRDGLGVIVASPNTEHVPGGLACVAAGVPVLVEKPIADTETEAWRLVGAAESAGVPLLVGHHRRHSPLLRAAQRVVADGGLGAVVAVQGSALFAKPDHYFDAAPWRREPGGGPILINLIHEIDGLRAICGDIVEVQAMSANATRGFPVEDTVALTLRFASGALGVFLLCDAAASTANWELSSRENADYPFHPGEDCYLIAGTSGSLAVPSMTLHAYPGAPSWWTRMETSTVSVDRSDPLANQLDHFVDVVRGVAEPLVTGRDATRTLRVTRAVARAASTGTLVRIPDPGAERIPA